MTHPALFGLLLYAACRAIELLLEAQSMAGIVGQAILVEWGASRLKVQWSPPDTPITAGLIARRIGIGLAVGLVAAGAVFATLIASRAVLVESVHHVEPSVIALGLLTAGLYAWRDELLFHGIVLRALEKSPPLIRVLACGLTSAGAALGRSDATARSVFVALLLGTVFGTLWLRDRGAWQPWAAHCGFRFAVGTLLSGGIVHSRLAANSWGGGSAGMLGGGAAALALAPFAVLALVTVVRTSPQSGPVG